MGTKIRQGSGFAEKRDESEEGRPTSGFVQTRYVFALMMFLGWLLGVSNRVALSVVIVGMIDQCKPLTHSTPSPKEFPVSHVP